jgi:hypothetical protein
MDFIFIENNSLSKNDCEHIINLFNSETTTYDGVTNLGVIRSIKNTTDYFIDCINTEQRWKTICELLTKTLQENIKKYTNYLQNKYQNNFYFTNNMLFAHGFLIQKYKTNEGQFLYHNDFSIKDNLNMHRVLTFIWYLNDVDVGGETEFCGDFNIKPETGKFVFFPASWCYPHKGSIPVSNAKYIITGWLHCKNNL